MCGIFGYIGKTQSPAFGLEGLKRLEYRGYDSVGIAFYEKSKNKILCFKSAGKIENLKKQIEGNGLFGNPIITHTRWATHGSPTSENAHPHCDCSKKIFVVHNGIIENYKQLKEKLVNEGHIFSSETDSEVIPHLIEQFQKERDHSFEEHLRLALKLIKGTFGLAVIFEDEPDKIIVARRSSPLIIGLGENERFVASDPTAILPFTREVVYLDDDEMAVISDSRLEIKDLEAGIKEKSRHFIEWSLEEATKGGYPHYMLKEIFEKPEAIENSLRGRLIPEEGLVKLGGLENVSEELRRVKNIIIAACGTSYYAGLVGEYMLEEYAEIPVETEIASEFRYRKPVLTRDTALIAVSQSGETADTLEAVKEANRKGILTLGIVNVVGSSIARETKAGVYNRAGPEISVASTKAFSSQVAVLALFTLFFGRQREMSFVTGKRIAEELLAVPSKIRKILERNKTIKNIAEKYAGFENFIYLGRKYNYPAALEGALKLKEISYIHAEGYGAGEMKHGPLALIDENFPCVVVAPKDSVYEKTISAIEEVKARGARVIAIATEGDSAIADLADDIIYIPKTLEMLTPILSVVPLHLLAYHIAVFRGADIDQPRNLAKSVTVE